MKSINYKEILTMALTFAVGIIIAHLASKALAKVAVGTKTTTPNADLPELAVPETEAVATPETTNEDARTQSDIFNEKFHARGRMHY